MAKAEKEIANPYFNIDDKIENTLLESRRIFLSDAFDSETFQRDHRKLWYLELKDPGRPILLVINSLGGAVDAGFAI